MLISFTTLLAISYLTNYLFDNGYVSEEKDYLKIIERREKSKNRRNQKKNPDDVLLTERYTKKEEGDNNEKVEHKNGNGLMNEKPNVC